MKRTVLFLLILSATINIFAQNKSLPTIRTKLNRLVLYVNGERDEFNGINEISKTFSYDFALEKPSVPFALVSEKDSVAMMLTYGVTTDFQIIREGKGDTVLCHFTSHKPVKAAVFNEAYKQANQGKTIVEIPEVYELINVVFALTKYGKTEAIFKDTEYYKAVIRHFLPYKNHRAVVTFDSLLARSEDYYHNLKMDSYAYRFDGDHIQNGGVYDRVSWGENNNLIPYVPMLEQFARQSDFRTFFQKNDPYYKNLITDFRKNVDVATMKAWLEKQFPSTYYSAIKVIFTPLVGWNQSANRFEDNGFTEAQMHINFPFVSASQKNQPPAITRGERMKIAFTELNHSYLNPEADKYATQVSTAFQDLSKWTTPNTPSSSSYNNPLSCFEEYMNYALVTLLFHDLFDTKTFTLLTARTEKSMTTNRGFRKFGEFDQELLRLYQSRKPGQTVADLYPAIIGWAAKQ
ncbi:DUF4932 domain-containing protein [Spirosoma sp. KNUC1025]|uniref:DUF4932 domain-containing protein n=1 Tax=Spirosoma sp. KNUC1025 TaxID=2894082 RepID=UPI003867E0B9|nr:DUF4932 domain-containing protein [Spirosoma sp. KNUC1025]